MLNFLPRISAIVVLFAIAIGFAAAARESSSSFQQCQSQHEANYAAQQQPKYISLFFDRVFAPYCTALFIDQHNAAITAIATVLLTCITGGLVWTGYLLVKTTRTQLRAYLSVVVGAAIYQDRAAGLRFEAKPMISNNGQTPAYNVRYRAKSEILTDSVALTYVFSAPPDTPKSQASIGPKENRLISAVLPHMVADTEVDDIKRGTGKALWVWGVVHYEDVYRRPHFTEFCQRLTWLPDDRSYRRILVTERIRRQRFEFAI